MTTTSELDIYVLVENATIASLKNFAAKWTRELADPSEYIVRLPNDSLLEFDNIEDFLVQALLEDNYASLYWTGNNFNEMDSVFIFFKEDGSVMIGLGVRFEREGKTLPSNKISLYFKELVADLDVVAGYVTHGIPAESRSVFLSVAQQSEAPKVWNGVVIES